MSPTCLLLFWLSYHTLFPFSKTTQIFLLKLLCFGTIESINSQMYCGKGEGTHPHAEMLHVIFFVSEKHVQIQKRVNEKFRKLSVIKQPLF